MPDWRRRPGGSGSVAHEQGISKAGNPQLRTTMVQLAWLWVRHQPSSILTLWFHSAQSSIVAEFGKCWSLPWRESC
jgi:transposase